MEETGTIKGINIKLSGPRYKGLNCLIVVYYSRVEPRYNEPLYDEFLM